MEQFIYSCVFAAYVGPDSPVVTVLIWATLGLGGLFWVLHLLAVYRPVKMWVHRIRSTEHSCDDGKKESRERVKPFPMKNEDFYQKMMELNVGDWLEVVVSDKFYYGGLLICRLASFYSSKGGPYPYGAYSFGVRDGVSICTINPAEDRYVVWSGSNPTKYWVIQRKAVGQRKMKFRLTCTEGTLSTLIEEQQRFN